GASAAHAHPIGTDGKFAGTDAPASSLWYKFNYIGGNQSVIATLTFEPADSTRLDMFLFTGDPSNPTAVPGASTLNGNVRTITYTDPGGPRVWYRFYYGNPGADATISISIAPTADNADLNVYTGTDPTNLGPTQQGGSQVKNGNTISRHVNLPNPQFVFFSLGNNGSSVI